MQNEDTIAAISSGLTESGIGIVRLSGPESFRIADMVFRKKTGAHGDFSIPNRVMYGYVLDLKTQKDAESYSSLKGRVDVSRETSEKTEQSYDEMNCLHSRSDLAAPILDEVLVIVLKGPHSYTGEDTVEFDCHGGVLMMKRILDCLLRCGARLADPGEFTKRAFLNGRIDLAQAEAVIDVINAKNERAARASLEQLRGSVSAAIEKLRNRLLEDTAFIEAALDDPEHYDLDENWNMGFSQRLQSMIQDLDKLVSSFRFGKIVKEGINTVILGKPNAGKSSLLNALLGEDRAIVTMIPGTTRDTIRESISLGSVTLNLMDTAGIRRTEDPVEKIGVDRALQYADQADLVLFVLDAAADLSEEDRQVMHFLKEHDLKTLVLLNKSDLATVVGPDTLRAVWGRDVPEYLSVSAVTGAGIHELISKIEDMFALGEVHVHDELMISSLRHAELLQQADNALLSVMKSMEAGVPEDLYTVDLMEAYGALGKIIGLSVDEDLINEIFGKFCMGK